MNRVQRLVVPLDLAERNALATLARRERRDIREQAAFLICLGLTQAGCLPAALADPQPSTSAQTSSAGSESAGGV